MLEKPDIADGRIVEVVQTRFGIDLQTVTFLPLGADVNTAVYRGDAVDGSTVFIKLRRGDASGLSVQIPHTLHTKGVEAVIAPIGTRDGQHWAEIDAFLVTLTPYVNGQDGFERRLTDEHWTALGQALRGIHTATLPDALRGRLPREDFSDAWREMVRAYQAQSDAPLPDDAARQMAEMMHAQRPVITELLDHAQRFGDELRNRELAYVPCHADIHAGNVLIDDTNKLYVVDWDTFMLAPKERDLMFIGAGIGSDWQGERPARCFYAGYGPAEVDPAIIAYYRCERIIQDIAATGEQLFPSAEGGADRERALHFFASNFEPGSTIDLALDAVEKAGTTRG